MTEQEIDRLIAIFEREHGPIGEWITYLSPRSKGAAR